MHRESQNTRCILVAPWKYHNFCPQPPEPAQHLGTASSPSGQCPAPMAQGPDWIQTGPNRETVLPPRCKWDSWSDSEPLFILRELHICICASVIQLHLHPCYSLLQQESFWHFKEWPFLLSRKTGRNSRQHMETALFLLHSTGHSVPLVKAGGKVEKVL